MNITFDPIAHRYTDENGVSLPSVTQILDSCGFVGDWCKGNEAAMLRGTYVHRAVALHLKGTLDEDSLDDITQPYLEAFKKFMRESKFEVSRCEQLVYHQQYRYAGTYDLLGKLRNRAALIDLKTGDMPKWAALQTAGYSLCLGKTRVSRHGLELRSDGTYGLYDFTDDARDASVFLHALSVCNWKMEK